jgi:hypothetical protein
MAGKVRYDIAPQIRKAFMEALKIIEDQDGLTFPEIMAECIRKNPLNTLQAVARFAPREKEVRGTIDHTHKHSIDTAATVQAAAAIVGQALGQLESQRGTTLVQDQPILLDQVRTEQE